MTSISIIIPTFKRVEQTIKTIRLIKSGSGYGESYKAEIIVSDCTPDESLKKAIETEFGVAVSYTRPKKTGIAAAKNQGAHVAGQEILIFCDSDMEVERETVALTIAALTKHKKAAAIGGQVIWQGGPHDGKPDRPRPEDRLKTVDDTTYVEAIYSRYIATYKSIFDSLGGYDEAVFNMRGEGSDLSTRYWRAGFPLAYESSIVVHHVYDAPDSAALRVSYPEWGVAKDLLLLAYKYDMLDGHYPNFEKTVAANFKSLGDVGFFRILQGVGQHYDFITSAKEILDQQKKSEKPKYDFKFLEVFSNEEFFQKCVRTATLPNFLTSGV